MTLLVKLNLEFCRLVEQRTERVPGLFSWLICYREKKSTAM